MLAGTLGGIIGSVFSGIHLARARSALSMLGPFGFISGLAGYTCFRSFDSFSSEAMLTDNNRREIVSGLLTPMLPYILLGRVLTTLEIPVSGVVYGPYNIVWYLLQNSFRRDIFIFCCWFSNCCNFKSLWSNMCWWTNGRISRQKDFSKPSRFEKVF